MSLRDLEQLRREAPAGMHREIDSAIADQRVLELAWRLVLDGLRDRKVAASGAQVAEAVGHAVDEWAGVTQR